MSARLSVNINDETQTSIRSLQDSEERSATEIVRRAVAVYEFVVRELAEGKSLRSVDAAGNITEVVLL
ncbi:MAG: hypothetical protein ABWY58_01655 [Aeromicrobium sp.]